MDIVNNQLIRKDHYMTRETLKTEQGKTTLPNAKATSKKVTMPSSFDVEIYVRTGNSLRRGQDVMWNYNRNITTLQGARELMEGKGKTQEQRILYAIDYERNEDRKKDMSMTDNELEIETTPTEHNFAKKKPIITSYITPTGKEIPDKLRRVTTKMGKSHLIGKMHKNKLHGDAGLPIGEQGF